MVVAMQYVCASGFQQQSHWSGNIHIWNCLQGYMSSTTQGELQLVHHCSPLCGPHGPSAFSVVYTPLPLLLYFQFPTSMQPATIYLVYQIL